MRTLALALVIPALVGTVPPVRAAQSDAGALASAARQALGGAVLDTITSLSVSGSEVRHLGPVSPSSSVEISYVSPDKFIRVSRRFVEGPISFDITDYEGFSGDEAFHDTVAPGAPMPVTIPGPTPTTPEEIAAARVKRMNGARERCLLTLFPLFLSLPASHGVVVSAGGKVVFNKIEADALTITRADGRSWRLLLDAATHLPLAMMWKAKPIVTFSTTSTTRGTVRTGPGGTQGTAPPPEFPPNLPPGDPTAGLADVDWIMTLGEYKAADGVNWPRRFRTYVDGKEWEDFRISRYRINPKIDPKIFERKR